MTEFKGASQDDWFNFDFNLGLGGNLLPCVPAGDDVRVLAGSALAGKVGKIPSQFNHAGEAHGLTGWQRREIMSNEVATWSQDRRLNLCVRTGPISGVYAFDVDVEDYGTSNSVRSHLLELFPDYNVSIRERANTAKFLIAFRMEESCKKRKIKLDDSPKGPAIELLADGQQFVACGSHSSGSRYLWLPGLPESLPLLTLAQVNQIWETLTKTYATTSSKQVNLIASAAESSATPATTSSTPTYPSGDTTAQSSISESDFQDLISALRFLLDKVADNDTWSKIGYALLSLQGTRPVQSLWLDFSRKAAGYQEGAAEAWWDTHKHQTPRSDYRSILKLARDAGLPHVADPAAFPLVRAEEEHGDAAGDGGGAAGGGDQPAGGPDGDVINVVPNAPAKPVVQLRGPDYSNIVDRLELMLVPQVFVQGTHLSRLVEPHADPHITRADDALMLVRVTSAWAMKRLGELCEWQTYSPKQGAWTGTKPSVDHINTLVNQSGWTQFRPLDAIARSPFVRPDGSICDVSGYDRRSRVLLVPSAGFPPVPDAPDRDQALAALGRIRGVFDQFPYKEPASESAFLSHILAEAARVAIDRCPMYFYDAPSAGTGKGLLQEMAARIVHGTDPALRPWVSDGDEIRKSLYASLLAGDRSLWFDNVPSGHKTRSPELCAFITSSTWKDRKLGESETLGIPNKMVLVASGNNITPTGDLARRSLVVRMDANTERLKERSFRIPLLREYVMEHRHGLLVDALTIIKAFAAQHNMRERYDPKGAYPVPLPSFERWSFFCRNPLMWLGMVDPVGTQNETDDETDSVGNIYESLAAQFGGREFTSMDVARLVNGITDSSGELASEMMNNGCREPNSPIKVGYWLRGYRDRISNGLKLTHAGTSKAGVKWRFTRLNEDLT